MTVNSLFFSVSKSLIAITCLSFVVSSHAQTVKLDMQAGLWEHQIKLIDDGTSANQAQQMQAAAAEMQKQLASLPPEQRKMMEEIFARQGMSISGDGITFGNKVVVGLNGTTVKQCVTQEQIDKGFVPKGTDQCQSTVTKSSKTQVIMTYTCQDEPPTTGQGEITFTSPKAFQGKASFTSTENGKPNTMNATMTGKWLSSDCGDIKPEEY